MIRIGLIVNPVAGMGGRVGLKGTDGLADQARALGALPEAEKKTARALAALQGLGKDRFCLVPAPGPMGEGVAMSLDLPTLPLGMAERPRTSAQDTWVAARYLAQAKVDLILFAGGDGTARDICRIVGEALPVIGIPAGVKIHSPVFAVTPEAAGSLARSFVEKGALPLSLHEVLDIDEAAYRQGRVTPKLFGYMKVPLGDRIQGRKTGSALGEAGAQNLICLDYLSTMDPTGLYLIGPGTTTRGVMTHLNLPATLLGVDLVQGGRLVRADATESQILELIQGQNLHIFITPIGGQGHLFGRGNHQISPKIIRAAGKERIRVGATLQKIGTLRGRPFQVDTGDPEVDRMLSGYIRVITGFKQEMIYPVA